MGPGLLGSLGQAGLDHLEILFAFSFTEWYWLALEAGTGGDSANIGGRPEGKGTHAQKAIELALT